MVFKMAFVRESLVYGTLLVLLLINCNEINYAGVTR